MKQPYAQTVNASHIPGSNTRQLTATVPTKLYDVIDRLAREKNLSKSELMRKFLFQAATSEENRL